MPAADSGHGTGWGCVPGVPQRGRPGDPQASGPGKRVGSQDSHAFLMTSNNFPNSSTGLASGNSLQPGTPWKRHEHSAFQKTTLPGGGHLCPARPARVPSHSGRCLRSGPLGPLQGRAAQAPVCSEASLGVPESRAEDTGHGKAAPEGSPREPGQDMPSLRADPSD